MKNSSWICPEIALILVLVSFLICKGEEPEPMRHYNIIFSPAYSYRTGYVSYSESAYSRSGYQLNFDCDYYLTHMLGFRLLIGGGLIASQQADITSTEFGESSSEAKLSTIYLKIGPAIRFDKFSFFLGLGVDRIRSYLDAFNEVTDSYSYFFSYTLTGQYSIPISRDLSLSPVLNFNIVPFQEIYTLSIGLGICYSF